MPKLSVALPMYIAKPAARAAFWQGLKRHMREAGLEGVPEELDEPEDLTAHWLDDKLLLSQTCGYPLVKGLAGRVRLVGTPLYAAPGCEGAFYRSRIMVRSEDPAQSLTDLRGRRAAINSRDSQSGHNCLRVLVAPHANAGRFFDRVIETGGHRASLALLRQSGADVAAIDCVTYALTADAAPDEVAGLRTLCLSRPAPGLPLITALGTSDEDLARLRAAFSVACADPALAESRAALRLIGLEPLPLDAYAACLAMEAEAVALGYPLLV